MAKLENHDRSKTWLVALAVFLLVVIAVLSILLAKAKGEIAALKSESGAKDAAKKITTGGGKASIPSPSGRNGAKKKPAKKEAAAKDSSGRDTAYRAKDGSALSGYSRDELLKMFYMADDSKRREMIEKLGAVPSSAEFKKMLDELNSNYGQNRNQISLLIKDWFSYDRNSFVDWFESLPNNSPLYYESINLIATSWPQDDADSITKLLGRMTNDQSRDMMIMNIMNRFGGSPDLAKEWFSMVKNEGYKPHIAFMVARGIAQKDPDAALKWLEGLPGSARDNAFSSFLTNYAAEKDPQEALRMADRISDQNIYDNTLANIVSVCSGKNPQLAADIIDKMQRGSTRDRCCQNFAFAICGNSPETAMQWAEEIDDGNMREGTIPGVASNWINKDPASFNRWFKDAQLNDKLRKQLQQIYTDIMKQKGG